MDLSIIDFWFSHTDIAGVHHFSIECQDDFGAMFYKTLRFIGYEKEECFDLINDMDYVF